MEHDVFISYSSKNKKVADAMCHVLEEHRIKCWIAPRDIPGGTNYGDVIEDAIKNCRIFIIIFSKPASLSNFVSAELNVAFSEKKYIIPYRIDETPLKGSMRLYLNQTHWIDAVPDAEARFKDLVEVVFNIIGEGPYSWFQTGQQYYEAKNYAEAVKWFRKAAEQGLAESQNRLGECYYYGNGVPQDYTEAVRWFCEAAEQGLADAQNKLGFCYAHGQGVTQDYQEAVKWYRKAAEQGKANAQYNLGYCYDSGRGVAQNRSEAVKWYRKAAKQGHVKAQNSLGECKKGTRVWRKVISNLKKTVIIGLCITTVFAIAILPLKFPKIQYYIGEQYYAYENFSKAAKWLRKAAEQGDTDAQFILGKLYATGEGVPQDYQEAVKWLRKAAEKDNAEAELMLILMGESE